MRIVMAQAGDLDKFTGQLPLCRVDRNFQLSPCIESGFARQRNRLSTFACTTIPVPLARDGAAPGSIANMS